MPNDLILAPALLSLHAINDLAELGATIQQHDTLAMANHGPFQNPTAGNYFTRGPTIQMSAPYKPTSNLLRGERLAQEWKGEGAKMDQVTVDCLHVHNSSHVVMDKCLCVLGLDYANRLILA